MDDVHTSIFIVFNILYSEALFAANKSKEDISMIHFTCSSCKTASPTIGDLINDIHTLKNDISKRIDDKAIEIKTYLDNKMVEVHVCQKQSFADIVSKCKVPNVEKINTGVRDAIDSSTIAAKEQEFRDRSIMMFKRAECKAPNKKERLQEDLDFINDFVKEGLHIQTTDIEWAELVDMKITSLDPLKSCLITGLIKLEF